MTLRPLTWISLLAVAALGACSSTSENPASGGAAGSGGTTSSGGSAGATSGGGTAGAISTGGVGATGGVAGAVSLGGSAGTAATGGSAGATGTGATGAMGGSGGCSSPPSYPSGDCAGSPAPNAACSNGGTCCVGALLYQCDCDNIWHAKTDSQCCPSNSTGVKAGNNCSTAATVTCCDVSNNGYHCVSGKWAATGGGC